MISLSIRSALSLALAAFVLHDAPTVAQEARPAPAASDTIPPSEDFSGHPPLPQAEANAVRAVAGGYIAAAHQRDGAAAARLVSRGTRDYYARMAAMAVSAPEAQVRAAPLMERIMILMYRHRVPPARLRALTGDAAFAYTIDEGWVSENAGENPDLSALQISGNDGHAVAWDGEEGIYFVKEDGAWRWDMMPTIRAASATLVPPPDSGMTEDEFVMFILKYSNSRDPSPDIWRPLP